LNSALDDDGTWLCQLLQSLRQDDTGPGKGPVRDYDFSECNANPNDRLDFVHEGLIRVEILALKHQRRRDGIRGPVEVGD
jgi:hypothetical protein